MLTAVNGVRFAYEDWNKRHWIGKRSSAYRRVSQVQQLSPASKKAVTRTSTGPRLADAGRSTSPVFHSSSGRAQTKVKQVIASPLTVVPQKRLPRKSVQSRGTQLTCTPVPLDASVRLHHRSTSPVFHSSGGRAQTRVKQVIASPLTVVPQKRLPRKSVQSRGTQLTCTPVPLDASVRLPQIVLLTPSSERVPRVLSQLEQTPLESASLAWNHYRSQTPHSQQSEMSADNAAGNITLVKNRSDLVLGPNFGLRPNLHKFFKLNF